MGGTRAEEMLLRKDEQGPLHIMLQKVGFILGATWSQQTGGRKEVIWIKFTFEKERLATEWKMDCKKQVKPSYFTVKNTDPLINNLTCSGSLSW